MIETAVGACAAKTLSIGTSTAEVSAVEISKGGAGTSFSPDTKAELSNTEKKSDNNNPDSKANANTHEGSRIEVKDGAKHYYDDNGNQYRVGNDLLPNNQYDLNGYSYKTDDLGRVKNASGKLHLKEHQGRQPIEDSLHDIGKGDERSIRDAMGHPLDDRGHLIGDQFGGAPNLGNLIPQDAKVNQGIYKNLEDRLAKQTKAGKDVYADINVKYNGESRRPESLIFKCTINGEKSIYIFPNDRSGL